MELINNFGALLAIITLFLGAAVYLYGTVKRGRADIVRQDNVDLRASNQDKSSKLAGLQATVEAQQREIKNLQNVATQTPAVTQLIEITTKQQALTNKQHGEVIKQLSELAKQMSKMTTEFSHIATAMVQATESHNGDNK